MKQNLTERHALHAYLIVGLLSAVFNPMPITFGLAVSGFLLLGFAMAVPQRIVRKPDEELLNTVKALRNELNIVKMATGLGGQRKISMFKQDQA